MWGAKKSNVQISLSYNFPLNSYRSIWSYIFPHFGKETNCRSWHTLFLSLNLQFPLQSYGLSAVEEAFFLHLMRQFANADKLFGSDIKMRHTTQPTAHLFYVCQCIPPSGVSFLWLTWFFVCWQLVSGDGAHTDAGSVADSLESAPPLERTGGIGESRPPSYQWVQSENTLLCISCSVQ